MDVKEFYEDLATKKSFLAPFTFGRARELFTKKGRYFKEILVQGFLSEKLVFFPSVKFRDIRGSHRLTWNTKDYVVLQSKDAPAKLGLVAEATLKTCSEIERRSLSYSRNLEKYRDHGMSWVEKVLERLPPSVSGQLKVNAITMASCIGMLMNCDYVDFNHLQTLLQEMSPNINQAMLQKWRIQLRFTLPKVYKFLFWKLHEDIPHRALENPKFVVKRPQTEDKHEDKHEEETFEDVQQVDEQDGLQPMLRSKAKTVSVNTKAKWSALEDANICVDRKITDKEAYEMYVKSCIKHDVPVRTEEAFRRRRVRLRNKDFLDD